MAGVKFEIRDSSGAVVETVITDENGKAISSALTINAGKENVFTVKEVSAPDYVYLNETVFEAVLVNDNEIKLEGFDHGFIGGATGLIKEKTSEELRSFLLFIFLQDAFPMPMQRQEYLRRNAQPSSPARR